MLEFTSPSVCRFARFPAPSRLPRLSCTILFDRCTAGVAAVQGRTVVFMFFAPYDGNSPVAPGKNARRGLRPSAAKAVDYLVFISAQYNVHMPHVRESRILLEISGGCLQNQTARQNALPSN